MKAKTLAEHHAAYVYHNAAASEHEAAREAHRTAAAAHAMAESQGTPYYEGRARDASRMAREATSKTGNAPEELRTLLGRAVSLSIASSDAERLKFRDAAYAHDEYAALGKTDQTRPPGGGKP